MTERTCEGCRWFRRTDNEHDVFGECRRFPPLHSGNTAWLAVRPEEWCGEWSDKTITPEPYERRELVRQFAVAMVAAGSQEMVHQVWQRAAEMADYEGQT